MVAVPIYIRFIKLLEEESSVCSLKVWTVGCRGAIDMMRRMWVEAEWQGQEG